MQSVSNSTRTFMSTPPKKEGDKKPSRKRTLPKLSRLNISRVFIVLLLSFSVFMFIQYRQATDKLQTATTPAANRQRVDDVVSRVGKLIILPTNEEPTIITVKDAVKLRSEKFYANAKNGDITLVYSNDKKAILYRPSDNIIVNVSNVTIAPATQ